MEQKKDNKHYHPIFDKKGKTSYYLDQDKVHIYSWEGEAVAFVEKGAVFSFKKKHLGWYDEGWLRDLDGKCIGCTEPGKGGPNPPRAKHPAEPPAEKKEPPEKPEITETPERPVRKPMWSEFSEADFFAGKKAAKKK